jgi:hypothetical protein
MKQKQKFEELINEFCHITGFDTPQQLLESGEVLVDNIAVSLFVEEEIADDDLVLYSDIALRPHEININLYQKLLQANLFWSGTNGATIGMNPETGRIGLAKRLSVEHADGNWLVQELYHFSKTATQWRAYFEQPFFEISAAQI